MNLYRDYAISDAINRLFRLIHEGYISLDCPHDAPDNCICMTPYDKYYCDFQSKIWLMYEEVKNAN